MKYIFYLLATLFIYCCYTYRQTSKNNQLFSIYKIDSINNYYVIYAEKQDTFYKIVSKKEQDKYCRRKIRLNGKYKLNLNSIWEQDMYINGVNVGLKQTPRVNCIGFDENTFICLEKDSINDLYVVEKLNGLCIVE